MFIAKTTRVLYREDPKECKFEKLSLLGIRSTTQPVKMSSVALDEICQN